MEFSAKIEIQKLYNKKQTPVWLKLSWVIEKCKNSDYQKWDKLFQKINTINTIYFKILCIHSKWEFEIWIPAQLGNFQ